MTPPKASGWHGEPERIPQRAALSMLLAAVAGNEEAGGMFEVRYRLRGRAGMGQCFQPIYRVRTLVETIDSLGQTTDTYRPNG